MKLRDSQGGAYESRGRYYARVTVAAQDRRGALLPWCTSLDVALVRARAIQVLVSRVRASSHGADLDFIVRLLERSAAADEEMLAAIGRQVDALLIGEKVLAPKPKASDVVTFEDFAMRWVRGELAVQYPDHVSRKRTAATDLNYLRRYVFPVIGPTPIAEVTLEDFERVMREIPLRSRELRQQQKGARPRRKDEEARAKVAAERWKLKPATRRQIAQAMRRVMELASYPAKLVAHNPIPSNALPKVRTSIALQFLYPDEDAQAMKCVAFPIGYRLLFGFLARMGWRRADALGGEVERVEDEVDDVAEDLDDVPPLTWSRLDLKRGVVFIDRDKTKDPRPMPLDPGTWRALSTWHARRGEPSPDELVFVDDDGTPIDPQGVINRFHELLKLAEVNRPELFERSSVRRPIRVHDLRASFVTVAFANGRDERWVRDRTGHKSGALDRYHRVARTLEELDLGDWKPLDEAIPDLVCSRVRGGKRGGNVGYGGAEIATIVNDFKGGDRRGLNPRQLDPQSSALPAELRPP